MNKDDSKFQTTVYVKAANANSCLKGYSECSDKYKKSIIVSLVNRALNHSSSWPLIKAELDRIKQVLVGR